MKNYFTRACALQIAALVAISTAGCSKSPNEATAQGKMPVKDLGVVELTANTPKHVDLGEGRDCIITPKVLANGNLQVDLAVETKLGNRIERSQSRLTARSGMSCGISVGNLMINITPTLKAE